MANASPLIQIDVDGVLYPNRAWKKPEGYRSFRARKREMGIASTKPQTIWLNPQHGVWLNAMGCDMVWATSWEDSANRQIGSRIGLPQLPYISFSNRTFTPNEDNSHWKLDDVMLNADGRPFVWLDDGITGADTVRVSLEYPAPALLYRVDPRWGLTANDLLNVWQWLKAVSAKV